MFLVSEAPFSVSIGNNFTSYDSAPINPLNSPQRWRLKTSNFVTLKVALPWYFLTPPASRIFFPPTLASLTRACTLNVVIKPSSAKTIMESSVCRMYLYRYVTLAIIPMHFFSARRNSMYSALNQLAYRRQNIACDSAVGPERSQIEPAFDLSEIKAIYRIRTN